MTSLTSISWLLMLMWMLSGVFQIAFCAQMYLKTSDNEPVQINIYSIQLTRFHECMGSYTSCILHLSSDYPIFTVNYVSFEGNIIDGITLTYQCTYYYEVNISPNSRWSNYEYSVKCRYRTLFCRDIHCVGSPLFIIQWQDQYESFTDTSFDVCQDRYYPMCSTYLAKITSTTERTTLLTSVSTMLTPLFTDTTTATTTQLTSRSTFITTSKITTSENRNNTTNYDSLTSSNTNVTLATHSSQNTNTIIIGVVVSVCVVIIVLIIIYCIRKYVNSKTVKAHPVIFAKDVSPVEYNNITILNNVTNTREDAILNQTNELSKENCLPTYDEYSATYIPQTLNCTENYSNIDPSKYYNENAIDVTKNILEQQKGVYQNVNPDKETSLTKPYARLGENLRVVEHDYNCLLPEQNENQRNKGNFLVASPTHANTTNTDATFTKPYARLGEQVKILEHDYNYLLPEQEDTQTNNVDKISDLTQLNSTDVTNSSEYNTNPAAQNSVTEESSNPYSLAKVIHL